MRKLFFLIGPLIFVFSNSCIAEFRELYTLDISNVIRNPENIKVGDVYKALLNGEPHQARLTSIDKKGYTWIDNNNCISTKIVQFAPPVKWVNCPPFEDGESRLEFLSRIWPLKVGHKFQIRAILDEISLVRECEVLSANQVEILLGQFDTLKVHCKDLSNELIWYLSITDGKTIFHSHKNSYYNFYNTYELTE